MQISHVSRERCDLFKVVRTNLTTWNRQVLSYPPTDYATAVAMARHFKQELGNEEGYDYRVCHAD